MLVKVQEEVKLIENQKESQIWQVQLVIKEETLRKPMVIMTIIIRVNKIYHH